MIVTAEQLNIFRLVTLVGLNEASISNEEGIVSQVLEVNALVAAAAQEEKEVLLSLAQDTVNQLQALINEGL